SGDLPYIAPMSHRLSEIRTRGSNSYSVTLFCEAELKTLQLTRQTKKHLPPLSGDQQVLVTFLEPVDAENYEFAPTRSAISLVKRRARPATRLILIPPFSTHTEIAATPAAVGLNIAFGTR